MNTYYVYRHRKGSDNSVFYIGIGKQANYLRAKTRHNRNIYWDRIVAKNGFNYEILQDNLSFDDVKELEVFLITLYGRVDLKTGILCNLTDGGEGSLNVLKTEQQIDKWKISNKGKQNGKDNIMFGLTRGKHHLAKEVLNLETGIYYDCALDVSDLLGIPYSTLKSMLNNNSVNSTSFIYANNLENNISNKIKVEKVKIIKQKEEKRGWKKYVLDTVYGIYYESLREVADVYGYNYSSLKTLMRRPTNKFGLMYV